jgi:uncharacterized Zn finger protein
MKKLRKTDDNHGINYLHHAPMRCPECHKVVDHVINRKLNEKYFHECPKCGKWKEDIMEFVDNTKPSEYGIGERKNTQPAKDTRLFKLR